MFSYKTLYVSPKTIFAFLDNYHFPKRYFDIVTSMSTINTTVQLRTV